MSSVHLVNLISHVASKYTQFWVSKVSPEEVLDEMSFVIAKGDYYRGILSIYLTMIEQSGIPLRIDTQDKAVMLTWDLKLLFELLHPNSTDVKEELMEARRRHLFCLEDCSVWQSRRKANFGYIERKVFAFVFGFGLVALGIGFLSFLGERLVCKCGAAVFSR